MNAGSERERLAQARRNGAAAIESIDRRSGTPAERLGGFSDAGPRELALRRLLLTFRVPPSLLGQLERLVPMSHPRLAWRRFVSAYAFWLGARSACGRRRWTQITRGLPILMYHAFDAEGERDRYVLPARSFIRQLRLLRALRYQVIALEEFIDAMRTGDPLPRRAVVLTIDDGYEDNVGVAQSILRERGIPATVFLVTERLGADNDWSSQGAVAERSLLSIEQVKQAHSEGLGFGAHTRRHRPLPDAESDALREEVDGSRSDLEGLVGEPARAFAYPYGFVDERAMGAVADAGFEVGLAVDDRRATIAENPMRVPRIEICGTDSPIRFLRKLWR